MNIGGQETRTNLIINHLPHSLTDQEFHDKFSTIGAIKNYRIMRDLKTGASFGFGFVEYNNTEDAARAILQFNNCAILNKRLKVSFAQPPEGQDDKETNLYIQKLPHIYTAENLEQLFGQFGTIVQKLVFKDKATGMPRGVGFVKFATKAEAFAAIEGLNGKVPEGGSEPMYVKIANDSSTKKKTPFQAGFQVAFGRGRGRAQFSNRGNSFGRGSYTEMGFGGAGRGFGYPTDFVGLNDFNQQGGKMGLDRSNNRYNPIGSGGGYTAGTGIGLAYGEGSTAAAMRDPNATQGLRLTADGYVANAGAFGSVGRAGAGAPYGGRY